MSTYIALLSMTNHLESACKETKFQLDNITSSLMAICNLSFTKLDNKTHTTNCQSTEIQFNLIQFNECR